MKLKPIPISKKINTGTGTTSGGTSSSTTSGGGTSSHTLDNENWGSTELAYDIHSRPLNISSFQQIYAVVCVICFFFSFLLMTRKLKKFRGFALQHKIMEYIECEEMEYKGEKEWEELEEHDKLEKGTLCFEIMGCILLVMNLIIDFTRVRPVFLYLQLLQLVLYVVSISVDFFLLGRGHVALVRKMNYNMRFSRCSYESLLFAVDIGWAPKTATLGVLPISVYITAIVIMLLEGVSETIEGIETVSGLAEGVLPAVIVCAIALQQGDLSDGAVAALGITSLVLWCSSCGFAMVYKLYKFKFGTFVAITPEEESDEEGDEHGGHGHGKEHAAHGKKEHEENEEESEMAEHKKHGDADAASAAAHHGAHAHKAEGEDGGDGEDEEEEEEEEHEPTFYMLEEDFASSSEDEDDDGGGADKHQHGGGKPANGAAAAAPATKPTAAAALGARKSGGATVRFEADAKLQTLLADADDITNDDAEDDALAAIAAPRNNLIHLNNNGDDDDDDDNKPILAQNLTAMTDALMTPRQAAAATAGSRNRAGTYFRRVHDADAAQLDARLEMTPVSREGGSFGAAAAASTTTTTTATNTTAATRKRAMSTAVSVPKSASAVQDLDEGGDGASQVSFIEKRKAARAEFMAMMKGQQGRKRGLSVAKPAVSPQPHKPVGARPAAAAAAVVATSDNLE